MAYVRCINHPIEKGTHPKYALAPNYPDSGLICGRPGCNQAGLIALSPQEEIEFNNGRRIFDLPATNTAKIFAGNHPLKDF